MTLQEAVEQVKLIRDRKIAIYKLAKFITETEGNQSERFGLKLGLVPLWAKEKAEKLTQA